MKRKITQKSMAIAVVATTALQGTAMANNIFNVTAFAKEKSNESSIESKNNMENFDELSLSRATTSAGVEPGDDNQEESMIGKEISDDYGNKYIVQSNNILLVKNVVKNSDNIGIISEDVTIDKINYKVTGFDSDCEIEDGVKFIWFEGLQCSDGVDLNGYGKYFFETNKNEGHYLTAYIPYNNDDSLAYAKDFFINMYKENFNVSIIKYNDNTFCLMLSNKNVPYFPTKPYLTQLINTNDPSKITLTWEKANDDKTPQEKLKYYVYEKEEKNYDSIEEWETNCELLNKGGSFDIDKYEITGLNPDKDYNFRVIVEDEDGNKTASMIEYRPAINRDIQAAYDEINSMIYDYLLTENTTADDLKDYISNMEYAYPGMQITINNFSNRDNTVKFELNINYLEQNFSQSYNLTYTKAVSLDENGIATVDGVQYKINENGELSVYKVPNDERVIIRPLINLDGTGVYVTEISKGAFDDAQNMILIDYSSSMKDILLNELGEKFKIASFYTGYTGNPGQVNSGDSNNLGQWICAYICREPAKNAKILYNHMYSPEAKGYRFTGWKMIDNGKDEVQLVAQWSRKWIVNTF